LEIGRDGQIRECLAEFVYGANDGLACDGLFGTRGQGSCSETTEVMLKLLYSRLLKDSVAESTDVAWEVSSATESWVAQPSLIGRLSSGSHATGQYSREQKNF
jgi:hypothetical protein